jgi:predicted DCC family thiol-disulfide oxidoreductase YuxK
MGIAPGSAAPRLLVLFDADCGLCTRTAGALLRLDRAGAADGSRRLWLIPLQRAAAVAPDAPPEARLLEALHVRTADGRWLAGGAAVLAIADALPALGPLARLGRLPLLRGLVEPAYSLVVTHRDRLGRLLGADACRIRVAGR